MWIAAQKFMAQEGFLFRERKEQQNCQIWLKSYLYVYLQQSREIFLV